MSCRVCLLLALMCLAACAGSPPTVPTVPPVEPPRQLTLGISSSAAGLVGLINPALPDVLPTVGVQFVIANQETLWQDLEAGLLDAIFVHHVPLGAANWFNPVAMDGLVIIVHNANPVASLRPAEIRALFSGEVTGWEPLNGRDLPVAPLTREAGADSLLLLQEQVLGAGRIAVYAQVLAGDAALQAAVAGDETAVGFTMMGNVTGVKSTAVDGIAATPQTTAAQVYPFSAPLYFVHQTAAEPQGPLRALLAWLQSPAGQGVIGERYGRVR